MLLPRDIAKIPANGPAYFNGIYHRRGDISTASYSNQWLDVSEDATYSLDSSNRTYGIGSMYFNSSGTQVFLQDWKANEIKQYDLTTPWDMSTASYSNNSFDVSNEMGSVQRGITFDPAGTKMYTVDQINNTVYQYDTNA